MYSISSNTIYYSGQTNLANSIYRTGFTSGSINYGLINTYTYSDTYNRIGISAMNITNVIWAQGLDCQNLCESQTATAYVDETNSAVVIATTVDSNCFIFQLSSETGSLQSSFLATTTSYTSLTWESIVGLDVYNSNVFIYYSHISGYVAFRYSTTTYSVVEGFSDSSSPSSKINAMYSDVNGFLYFGIIYSNLFVHKVYYLDTQQRDALITGTEGVTTVSGYSLSLITTNYYFTAFTGSTSIGDSGITLNGTATYTEASNTIYDVVYDGGIYSTMTATGGSESNITYTNF